MSGSKNPGARSQHLLGLNRHGAAPMLAASPAARPETPRRSATVWTCRAPPQAFLRPGLTGSASLALDVIGMTVRCLCVTSFF